MPKPAFVALAAELRVETNPIAATVGIVEADSVWTARRQAIAEWPQFSFRSTSWNYKWAGQEIRRVSP